MDHPRNEIIASQIDKNLQAMTEMLIDLSTAEGIVPTRLENVRLVRANAHYAREPVFFEPSIVILANGCKKFYLGEQTVTYDPYHYFVLSVPLHFECETFTAQNRPLLGLSIHVDMHTLSELATLLDQKPATSPATQTLAAAIPMELEISDAVVRLLRALRSSQDAAVLGPSIVREIVYRALCGSQGAALMNLLIRNGSVAGVLSAMQRIHAEYGSDLNVAKLAADAGMSLSVFHHHFKSVAMTSPLQYLKSVRLQKARMLMVHDRLTASVASAQVGYESASQFAREFKRYFGRPPLDEASRLRNSLGLENSVDVIPPLPKRPDRRSVPSRVRRIRQTVRRY